MISFDEALERVCAIARPLGSETVPIDAAAGRVLAAPVIARIPSPRCDVSAMDGYAVRDADLAVLPARLQLIVESFAGPDDDVLYAWRSFEAYPIIAQVAGATSVQVPLTAGARHDLDAMAAAFAEQVLQDFPVLKVDRNVDITRHVLLLQIELLQ